MHGGFLLWVILGDWLFSPAEAPEIPVAEVSILSSAEFDKMAAAAAKAASAPQAAAKPPPQRPAPKPDPAPEVLPQAELVQPDPAPVPDAIVADEAQPVPVPDSQLAPAPRPIDRVADTPVDDTTDTPELADTVTPEVTEKPAEAVVEAPPEPAASPEEATTQIVTEAVKTEQDAPQLAPTASRRPQGRPKQVAEVPPVEEPPVEEPPLEVTDMTAVDDAVAAALAAAADPAPEPAAEPASGPPMTAGEKDALRVSIKKCWNLGALSSEAMRTTVTITVTLARDGTPDLKSLKLVRADGGTREAGDKMFEVARRAIARCGKRGFPLPPEKYERWKELELVFDPDGMRVR